MLSLDERDRRYRAIRDEMEKDDLEALVIASSSMKKGGVRYVSDYAIHILKAYCVFPLDGEPTLFVFAHNQAERALEAGWMNDVRQSSDYSADLRSRLDDAYYGSGKIGIVQQDSLSAKIYTDLEAEFGAESLVFTDVLDRVRTVKSEEEIELLRRSAATGSGLVEELRSFIEPGLNEQDVWARVKEYYIHHDSPYSFDIVASGESPTDLSYPTDRTLEPDDHVAIELTPTYHGYWTQVPTWFSVSGEYRESLQDKRAVWKAAREAGLAKLRPGNTAASVYHAMREVVEDAGYTFPHRGGHGHGVWFNETPMITPNSETVLEENMVLVLHPNVYDEDVTSEGFVMGDVWRVTDGDPERLHTFDWDV